MSLQGFRKRAILTFILFLMGIAAFAQNYSCSGFITDSFSGDSLAYATVRVLRLQDSTLYAAAITNEQGFFLIQNLTKGDYLFRIHCIGYQEKGIKISIQERRSLNLGKIELVLDKNLLPAINISAQAPVNIKIDRTVYQVDSAMLANATTSADLLSKIPGLRVNKTKGEVTIRGKEKTIVMLNGVLSPIEANILTINPQDIEQIEIITAPASEYSTEIESIVNIILKEKINKGFSFSISGWYCAPPWNMAQFITDFQIATEKIRYSFSYWYNFSNQKSDSDTTYRESKGENEQFIVYQSLEKPIKKPQHYQVIENRVEFYINKNNYLSLFTKNDFLLFSPRIRGYATLQDFNNLYDTIFSLHDYKEKFFSGDYTLFYKKKFNKENHYLTANFNFHHLYDVENSQYEESTISNFLLSSSNYREDHTKASRYSYNLKIDYYNPVSEKFTINTGALGYYQNFFNDYKDGGFSDTTYHYSTLKSHYYVDVLFHWKNFALRIGNKIEGYLAYMEGTKYVNQFSYLPSLAISQKIKTNHALRFNYRAVNYYPSVWNFNPYRTYSADSLSASEGNPKLKPSTLHRLSLEYLWNNDIVSLQTHFTYKYLHNDINFESALDNQNVLVSRPNNVNGKNSFSFFANTSLDFDFVYIDLSIEPYYEFFNNKNDHRKNFSFNTEVTVEFYIPYDFQIDINFFMTEKELLHKGL